jgi:selenocysteine-specific elongation factor
VSDPSSDFLEWPGAGAPAGLLSRNAAPHVRREGSTPSPLRPPAETRIDADPLTLGTAGHIDHGKTALIGALTGVDTDRLPEEHRRGISIALGYAQLQTPSGRRLSVVDVPGHERFVRTMVAGASGIDTFLMVIAADDGVMPQTVEHARILDALGIRHGLVAVTKSDLLEPQPAMQEARGLLPGCELVGCSAQTGEGLDELRGAIERLATAVPSRALRQGGVVLHIDRAFTIAGRGTVVTGTLWLGRVCQGETLTLMPAGATVRVRGIQVHNQQVTQADAGQRVAVNITGVHRDEVHRGDALTHPDALAPTSTLDCRLQLSGARHNMIVSVHHGTRAAPGRLAALGEDLWQVRLQQPLLAADGDRLVVRRPAPPDTLGGGVILNAHARRHGPKVAIFEEPAPARDGHPAGKRYAAEQEPAGDEEQATGKQPVAGEERRRIGGEPAVGALLRELPPVDRLAQELIDTFDSGNEPTPAEATLAARVVLDRRRRELQRKTEPPASGEVDLIERARRWLSPSLRRVLNGTGVVIHTNLGRAPLANAAAEALDAFARGYVNLELDLHSGRRSSRDQHLTELVCELTGAQDALAVNNGAAAVLLAVTALGGPGRSILVSRGQLVEIGGGFRMPDVIAQSGAALIEVGTTNRTHLRDYRDGIERGADLILCVHHLRGFTTVGCWSIRARCRTVR